MSETSHGYFANNPQCTALYHDQTKNTNNTNIPAINKPLLNALQQT